MNALRTSIRCFFGYLHEAGYLHENPARLLRRAICGSTRSRALSEEEQERLLDVLDRGETSEERRDQVLFKLMLMTGIRIGSALALDVNDVDLERGEVRLRRSRETVRRGCSSSERTWRGTWPSSSEELSSEAVVAVGYRYARLGGGSGSGWRLRRFGR